MIPNITHGAKMTGLVMYLAGPGRANEHTSPHVIAASSQSLEFAGASGAQLDHDSALDLAGELDTARVVFGTRVTRTNKEQLAAAQERGLTGSTALAEATHDENVWHCSLSLSPDEGPIPEEKWAAIAREFMAEMGFDSDGDAPARWAAIHHGATKQGGDHIHIVASRVRDDGSVVKLWFPEPGQSRNTGDKRRSQRVAAQLEERHGLRITTGRAERYTTKGANPAQENIAARTGRPEPVKATLARNVRGIAGAAESEAEFVRLARAHGLLIRPRYAAGSRDVVVGYSVALPTERYATRDGQPVWHGGGKLGNDLSLPRLRETWIAGDAATADAVSAWAHNHRERIDPTQSPSSVAAPTPRRARTKQSMTFEQARERLRDTVAQIAGRSRHEAEFVGEAFTHPDVLIRPRFAPGSTTEVTGYSVALRPHIYAREDGTPQWHGAGKLDTSLSLPHMRQRWAAADPIAVREEWMRAAGRGEPRVDTWRHAAADTTRWRERIETTPPRNTTMWAAAGSDTAATVSAWALRAERDRPAELSRLADALAATAGQQRSPGAAARQSASIARRAAAMILAASHDDPTQAYLVLFAQIAATARAIADAAEARGHATRAVEIRAALDAAQARYTQPIATQVTQRGTAATVTAQPVRTRPGRDTDYGR